MNVLFEESKVLTEKKKCKYGIEENARKKSLWERMEIEIISVDS